MIFPRFQEEVRRRPDHPAVAGDGRALTYADLEAAALRVAYGLAARGHPAERRAQAVVGLLVEHGVDMIPAVLGALRAGAIYVPLDPRYPPSRLAHVVEHAACDLLLTTTATESQAAALLERASHAPPCARLDALEAGGAPLPEPPAGDAAAYILYTSGSSGRPKGVLQTQRNLLYFAEHWIDWAGLGPADRVALVSSLGHDASIPDLFGSLLSGATLLPCDVRDGTGLAGAVDWLAAERVTMWHSVPTLYRRLAEAISARPRRLPDLRWIVLGGEAVRDSDLDLARRAFPAAELGVIYGQSESTITSVWRRSQDGPRVTLGTPIGSTRVLVADDDGAIVEGIGTGEIVVCSEHVAAGYWRDAAATEQAFTTDAELGRLYWTGDLGRVASDGSIAVAGRRDAQLKVRGHRVEPAEIEAALARHPDVVHAAVIGRPGAGGETALHAFVVSRAPIDPAATRAAVLSQLPDYMAPRWITTVDALPTLPTGKVDRAALAARPAPAEERPAGPALRTETEAKVAALWKRLLGVEHVGADSNFFDLGGHSLAILDLLAGVHDVFQTDLSFQDALQYRTVGQFARLIDGTRAGALGPVERAETREVYPLAPGQTRLFRLARDGVAATINRPAAVDVDGTLDRHLVRRAVAGLIARHESLRTSFAVARGEPVQIVHDDAACDLEEISVQDERAAERAIRAFVRPFDLARAPLVRVALLDRGERRATLLLDAPAIVCDAASRELLVRDLIGGYAQQDLPPLAIQGRDHAVWRARLRRSAALDAQERYWRAQLADPIPRVDLPADFERPAVFSFAGARVSHVVTGGEAAAFRRLAAARGATLFMALVAACSAVLRRRTARDDIVIGGAVPGRSHPRLAPLVGLFANDVVIRTTPRADLRFTEHLDAVRDVCVQALAHGDLPCDDLAGVLDAARDPSRHPLFDVRVSMAPPSPRSIDPAGIALSRRPAPAAFVDCDLTLLAFDEENGLRLDLEYASDLFRAESISAVARELAGMIRRAGANPGLTLGDLERSVESPTPGHDAPRAAGSTGSPAARRPGERPWPAAGGVARAGGGWRGIRRAERRDYYPASELQQAIYRKHVAAPGKYNRDPIAYELRGPLDVERLRQALDRLAERHALLRTSFHEAGGRIVQRVHPRVRCAVDVESCADAAVDERLQAFVRPFHLDEPPLWRVKLLSAGDERRILMFDIHHIVYDGDSIQTLVRELAALYRGAARLPAPKLEYTDYAVWEHRLVRRGVLDQSLQYWRETLEGVCYARLPDVGPAHRGFGIEEGRLDEETERSIARRCAELHCTRLGLLLSAFLRVLGRALDADDLAVGLRASTRIDPALGRVVGPFLNKVVIRSRAGRGVPFGRFAGEVQAALIGAIEHAVCPFDMVRRALASHTGRADTFPVLVNYEAIAPGPREVFGAEIRVRPLRLALPLTPEVVPYQIIFAIFDHPAGATLRVVYDRSCGTADSMRALLRNVVAVLASGDDAPAPVLAAVSAGGDSWTSVG